MATTITKLFRTGILQSSVEFDEITHTSVKIATDGVYASEFDEVTMDGSGFPADRKTRDGKLLVSGYFDEVDIGTPPPPPPVIEEELFTTSGTYSWTAPAGVTEVNVVAVGGGASGQTRGDSGSNNEGAGGGGGGLGWKNNIPVIPGQSYTVVVGQGGIVQPSQSGGDSYFISPTLVKGGGGQAVTDPAGTGGNAIGGLGGNFVGEGGGNGGNGGDGVQQANGSAGGGGAGGYSGNGGNGARQSAGQYDGALATDGQGGGGGGGNGQFGGGGGGVGLSGQGTSGLKGSSTFETGTIIAQGGSGGAAPNGRQGGLYGGGGGGNEYTFLQTPTGNGANGAVRIIWGAGVSFPNNAA
jgi:hypothetical protein